MKPEITCYSIISRDVGLLRWCIENARMRAGINHKWLVIGWDATTEVLQYCIDERIDYYAYEAKPENEFNSRTDWFLYNLYNCWELGMNEADTELIVRMGSDQFFSENWLKNLYEAGRRDLFKGIYNVWTTEGLIAKNSRHIIKDFGDTWDQFRVNEFDIYANHWIYNNPYMEHKTYPLVPAVDCGLSYNHPRRGFQMRPDGVSWLQSKEVWEKYGPFCKGYSPEGTAPDVYYIDTLNDNGVMSYLVPNSMSHHLCRGESRDIQE